MIEIRPGLERYLERKSLSFKRWKYINNIPSVKEIIDEIKDNHELNKQRDTYIYFEGVARFVPPIDIGTNRAVMTKHGIGRIKAIVKDDFFSEHIHKVVVEIMTNNYGKSRGYIKYLNPSDLTQLVVYHQPSDQFILLSPKDYVYLVDDNEEITYRVTNRKYATLSPDYKATAGYIKIFNEYRGGANVLRRLHAKGYVIVKQ